MTEKEERKGREEEASIPRKEGQRRGKRKVKSGFSSV